MRGLRNGFQKWKKRADVVGKRDGISMAIVICIGALLLAFSLAMAYTGSLMMASANTRMEEERAYQLAKSFAKVLDEQLCKYTNLDEAAGDSSGFYTFAYEFIGSSVYYDYNENSTVYTYSLSSSELSDDYGSVEVKLYKERLVDNARTALTGGTGNEISKAYQNRLHTLESTPVNRYDLTVEVVATYGESKCKYTYKTVYNCMEYLKLKLTDESGTSLYYKSPVDPLGSTYSSDDCYIICTDEACTVPYNTGSGSFYYTFRTGDGVIKRWFTQATQEKSVSTANGN